MFESSIVGPGSQLALVVNEKSSGMTGVSILYDRELRGLSGWRDMMINKTNYILWAPFRSLKGPLGTLKRFLRLLRSPNGPFRALKDL